MRWSGSAAVLLVIAAVLRPAPVLAQCSSCSSPLLPSESNGGSDATSRRGSWRGWAGLHYGYTSADQTYLGTAITQNTLGEKLALQIGAVTGGIEAPEGTSLGLTLPFASLWQTNDSLQQATPSHPYQINNGLGDIEVRVRQNLLAPLSRALPVHVAITGGFVAPTGLYIPNSVYTATIGRGVWWGLAELAASYDLTSQWAVTLDGAARIPSGSAPDGITWGPEAGGSAGVRFTQPIDGPVWVPKRVSLGLTCDYLWRAGANLIMLGQSQPIADVGGHFLSLSPTVVARLTEVLSLSVSVKVPIWRDANGSLDLGQLVPNTSVFVSLSAAFGGHSAPVSHVDPGKAPKAGEPPALAEISAELIPGRWTVVAYEATWCEACGRLSKQLEVWEHAHEGVVVKRLDATRWDRDAWLKFLPDASGLPVVDVFSPDGRLRARLIGDQAFRFREVLGSAP